MYEHKSGRLWEMHHQRWDGVSKLLNPSYWNPLISRSSPGSELIYFPATTTATANISRNLCPATAGTGMPTLCPLGPTLRPFSKTNYYDSVACGYVLPKATFTPESGLHVVSGGQTFYPNKVYISLKTIFASNQCGDVGSRLPGTILTLQSSDIYSIGGYHHEFSDVGYSFDFADLTSVPAPVYFMGCDSGGENSCIYRGSRVSVGRVARP